MKICKLFALSTIAIAMVISGCANYRLGTTLPAHLKTISIGTFQNQTVEPNIESRITSAVRREFQRDGQLAIVSEGNGDIILTGILTSYDVSPLLYEKNNPNTTRRYQAEIICKVEAVERATGKTLVSSSVSGDITFPAAGDVVTARRNSLDAVAKDLAKEVVDAVVSAW